MKKYLKIFRSLILGLALLSFIPLVAFAQGATVCGDGLGGIICKLNELLSSAIPLLVSLGVVYIVWGIVQYVIGGGDEAKTKGRDRIIYGIIGLAIIISLWGLVNIVVTTFDLGGQSAPTAQINNLVTAPASSSSCPNLGAGGTKLSDVVNYVTCFIGQFIIPLIFALATLMFIWGAVQFLIIGAGEEAKRTQGKQLMIWGIVALTVMLGVWSLVKIVGSTFGVDSTYLPQVKP